MRLSGVRASPSLAGDTSLVCLSAIGNSCCLDNKQAALDVPADRPREASLRGNRIAQRLLPAGGIRRDAMAVHTRMESFADAAEQTAKAERAIQEEIDRKEKARGKPEKENGAMQAGARRYPQPPFPKQHQKKPGSEAELDLAPMYDAPHYLGSEKLKDKVALVTGGDSGIGRAVAVLYAREGADVAVAYLNEHKDAEETKR